MRVMREFRYCVTKCTRILPQLTGQLRTSLPLAGFFLFSRRDCKHMMVKCLEEFFAEQDLPEVSWEVADRSGNVHQISNNDVREYISTLAVDEQMIIAKAFRRISFQTANINILLKHIAEERMGASDVA
jgi:hypothetical protein